MAFYNVGETILQYETADGHFGYATSIEDGYGFVTVETYMGILGELQKARRETVSEYARSILYNVRAMCEAEGIPWIEVTS